MHAHVLLRSLEEQWRALTAWTVGLALLTLTYLAFYPSISSSGVNIQQLLDQMPRPLRDAFLGAGVDYNTPRGYLGTELFAFLLPVILLVVAIVSGSRALAGEESSGTVDLLLATPLRRRRLVVEKALASTLPLFGLGAAVWLIVAAAGPAFGITVSLGGLAVAILAVVLLAAGFGVMALLVAGFTGRRGLGAGLAGALGVALYVLNAIGSTVPALQGPAGAVSPFHWSGGPGVLANGVHWSGVAALVLLPMVLLALAVLTYERRDLST
jgi:ABC-2 type transport system permease protein